MSQDKRLTYIITWVVGISTTLIGTGICALAAIGWDTRERVISLETKVDMHLQAHDTRIAHRVNP